MKRFFEGHTGSHGLLVFFNLSEHQVSYKLARFSEYFGRSKLGKIDAAKNLSESKKKFHDMKRLFMADFVFRKQKISCLTDVPFKNFCTIQLRSSAE